MLINLLFSDKWSFGNWVVSENIVIVIVN